MDTRQMQSILDENRPACAEYAQPFGVIPDIHPDDFIFRFLFDHAMFAEKREAIAHYFNDGAKSARRLADLVAVDCKLGARPFEMLEFASGFGCVTRHLKAVMPSCTITACDIHPDAIEFLQTRLGTTTLQSASVPEDLRTDRTFDVVFALSFFSHIPRVTFNRWLVTLASLVRLGGHLIFTAHGALSYDLMLSQMMGLDPDGFGFVASSEQDDLDGAEYGTTASLAQFVLPLVLELPGFRITCFREGFWWEHQDLYILRRVR